MPNPNPVGNRTARRGRKLRRLITLDDAAARALRSIVAVEDRAGDEDQLVADLILEHWHDLDTDIEQAADDAAGGETSAALCCAGIATQEHD